MLRKEQLHTELGSMQGKSLEALRAQWTNLFKLEPGPWISRDVLIRGLAWKLQEAMFGGISKTAALRMAQLRPMPSNLEPDWFASGRAGSMRSS